MRVVCCIGAKGYIKVYMRAALVCFVDAVNAELLKLGLRGRHTYLLLILANARLGIPLPSVLNAAATMLAHTLSCPRE